MGKVSDFKFGVRIDRETYKPKNAKEGQRVSRRSRDLLFFSDLSTSVERHSLRASYNL